MLRVWAPLTQVRSSAFELGKNERDASVHLNARIGNAILTACVKLQMLQ